MRQSDKHKYYDASQKALPEVGWGEGLRHTLSRGKQADGNTAFFFL